MTPAARALFDIAITPAIGRPVAEYAAIATEAAQALAVQHPKPAWRAVLRPISAESYRVQGIVSAMFAPSCARVAEMGEYPMGDPSSGFSFAEELQLKKFGRALPVTREQFINDRSLGFMADMVGALLGSAYRKEADELCALLSANPNLADGAPWFGADNSVSAASVPTAITAGLDALRSQRFPDGQWTHLEPFALVIPSAWHITLNELDAEFVARPPIIIRSAALSDGFALADPMAAPTIALMTLTAGGVPEVMVSPSAARAFVRELHSVVKVRHEFTVAPLSRIGIVKMTATGA